MAGELLGIVELVSEERWAKIMEGHRAHVRASYPFTHRDRELSNEQFRVPRWVAVLGMVVLAVMSCVFPSGLGAQPDMSQASPTPGHLPGPEVMIAPASPDMVAASPVNVSPTMAIPTPTRVESGGTGVVVTAQEIGGGGEGPEDAAAVTAAHTATNDARTNEAVPTSTAAPSETTAPPLATDTPKPPPPPPSDTPAPVLPPTEVPSPVVPDQTTGDVTVGFCAAPEGGSAPPIGWRSTFEGIDVTQLKIVQVWYWPTNEAFVNGNLDLLRKVGYPEGALPDVASGKMYYNVLPSGGYSLYVHCLG